MQVRLEMETDDGSQRSFDVSPGVTVIGRARRSDIRISLPGVEPKHCELVLEDGRLRIRDLGSSIGIHRNGRRVSETNLAHGDRLSIGQVIFRVYFQNRTSPAGQTLTEVKAARPNQHPPDGRSALETGEASRHQET